MTLTNQHSFWYRNIRLVTGIAIFLVLATVGIITISLIISSVLAISFIAGFSYLPFIAIPGLSVILLAAIFGGNFLGRLTEKPENIPLSTTAQSTHTQLAGSLPTQIESPNSYQSRRENNPLDRLDLKKS